MVKFSFCERNIIVLPQVIINIRQVEKFLAVAMVKALISETSKNYKTV